MDDEDARITELQTSKDTDRPPDFDKLVDMDADRLPDFDKLVNMDNDADDMPTDFDKPAESSQELIDKSMLFTDDIEDVEGASDSELADFDDEADSALADVDNEADKAAYAVAYAAVNGYQESGGPEPALDEQEAAVSTAKAKKSRKKLFQFHFTLHRLLIIALVVILFGTVGVFASVKIFGGEQGKSESSEAAQYVPSEMPYRFGDGAKVAEERSKERQKAEEEMQNTQGDSTSIVSQLYPQKEKNSSAERGTTKDPENRTDTAIIVADQDEGIPGPDRGELPVGEQNPVDNVLLDGVMNIAEDQVPADVSIQLFPEWETAAAKRNILMEIEKPFDIDAVSFQVSAERLITGRLDIVNHTSVIVENVFLELELMYDDYGVNKKQFQYAYVANVSLEPGQSKNISYAALPPDKWRGKCKLENIYVAAFNTTIDKMPYKVYVDRRNGLLELLERFI